MPRRKRSGRGFSSTKRGRFKTQSGGSGRGFRGRRGDTELNRSDSLHSTLVGEIPDDEKSHQSLPSSSHDQDQSNDSLAFKTALLSSNCNSPEDGKNVSVQSVEFTESDDSTVSDESGKSPSVIDKVCQDSDSGQPCQLQACGERTAELIQPDNNIISEVLQLLKATLPNFWIAIATSGGVQIMKLSFGKVRAVQRNIIVDFCGSLEIFVHRQKLDNMVMHETLKAGGKKVFLSKNTIGAFVDRINATVAHLRTFEICSGADFADYSRFWSSDDKGTVDTNPYDETRYVETFRSKKCSMLLPIRKWRCKECAKAVRRFKSRRKEGEEVHPSTPNIYLTEQERLEKLNDQRREIRNSHAQYDRLKKRFEQSLQSNGVSIDLSLEERLVDIFRESKLTPLQQLFISQQFKAASVGDKRQMRWHPTLIRFALLMKSNSSSTYTAMRQSGFLELPSERTLFDYSHTMPSKEGCFKEKFDRIYGQVKLFPEEYKKYHTLIMDEIHISQKLVYMKTSGRLVGYVQLTDAEAEMQELCALLEKDTVNQDTSIAKKMLVFMVKGICTKVKDVCASYSTSNLTKEDLYVRTWEVLKNCELAGIKILAVVGDGSSVNRKFFQMHPPITKLKSGLVFDTVNLFAPERPLYFISDGPHLLKTIRNCFSKSGTHPKCKRKLTKGGQLIVWKTIERLFLEDHENTWRQSFKLNPQNVYLNSYSCMKVAYAAQVMSLHVGYDLDARQWPGTSETVKFIIEVNNFFDNINGAHSQHGKQTANDRLAPYRSREDPRFEELHGFVKYLRDWEAEVMVMKNVSKKDKNKMLLADQTVEGIEITVNAFIGAVKFMLDESIGVKYVNARTFCQDAIEQYFGKQRAALGGKHNPNVAEFLNTENKISVHRDMNVHRRSGNTMAEVKHMEIDNTPLPKRKRTADDESEMAFKKLKGNVSGNL